MKSSVIPRHDHLTANHHLQLSAFLCRVDPFVCQRRVLFGCGTLRVDQVT